MQEIIEGERIPKPPPGEDFWRTTIETKETEIPSSEVTFVRTAFLVKMCRYESLVHVAYGSAPKSEWVYGWELPQGNKILANKAYEVLLGFRKIVYIIPALSTLLFFKNKSLYGSSTVSQAEFLRWQVTKFGLHGWIGPHESTSDLKEICMRRAHWCLMCHCRAGENDSDAAYEELLNMVEE
eukprot:c10933_g1_i2.p1 GENE.c10933_g1_i2~~c10933_g1_i2.p1  ORF type:complete len:182 (-),score=19.38 c10933_g1_i2:60-605(-)